MIASRRYAMKYYFVGAIVHSLCAAFITLTTIIWAFKSFGSMLSTDLALSIILLIAVCVVYMTGLTSAAIGRFYTTPDWMHSKEIHVKLGKLHKILAWPTVIFGFFLTSIEIIRYA